MKLQCGNLVGKGKSTRKLMWLFIAVNVTGQKRQDDVWQMIRWNSTPEQLINRPIREASWTCTALKYSLAYIVVLVLH
jgi:hypothetical protein